MTKSSESCESPLPANQSGRSNRIAPDGAAYAVAARGDYWGNRGQLLNSRGELTRHANGRLWIICALEFNGRQRVQWQPGRLTEIYFLDEPTALAAGHRPCGECRHAAYQRFKAAFLLAHPECGPTAGDIDRVLHAARISGGEHVTHRAALEELPDGVMISWGGGFWLLHRGSAYRWSFEGYGPATPRADLPRTVDVQTPAPTVAALTAGFVPDFARLRTTSVAKRTKSPSGR